MGLMEKWKARKEERIDPYTKEEMRLRTMIAQIDPLDENYDKLQAKLKTNLQMRSDSKEYRRKIPKSERTGVLLKLLSVGGAIGGGVMLAKYEKDGMTFTGEKRSMMDSLARMFGSMFMKH